MNEKKTNLEICQEALDRGEMPPFEAWGRLSEAARSYLYLQAVLAGKPAKKRGKDA